MTSKHAYADLTDYAIQQVGRAGMIDLLPAATAPTVLEAALAYHRAGVSILPIGFENGRKYPVGIKGYQNIWNPSAGLIRRWYQNPRFVGVALRPGAQSQNLIVIDCDGLLVYEEFCKAFPQRAHTYTERSGSGQGFHLFYQVQQLPDRQRTPELTSRKIARKGIYNTSDLGLEIFFDTGLITVAPSLHPTGRQYTIENDSPVQQVDNIDDLILWALALETEADKHRKPRRSAQQGRAVITGEISTDVIRAIESSLGVDIFNGDGWSENIPCPFKPHEHDAHSPGGAWNHLSHIFYCQKCGQRWLAKETAEQLGIPWPSRQKPTPVTNGNSLPMAAARRDSEFVPPDDLEQEDPFAHLPSVVRPLPKPFILPARKPQPDSDPKSILRGFLTLMLNFDPYGVLAFEFITRSSAAGLLDKQMFTDDDLWKARTALEKTPQGAPSRDTLQSWLAPDSKVLATIVEFVAPVKEYESSGGTNSRNYNRLKTPGGIMPVLKHRARIEGLKKCYPADELGAILRFDPMLLKAIGCAQPNALADAIESVRVIVDQKLAGEQTRAAKKLEKYMDRVNQYAACQDVIQWPDGMALRTTADVRAALARWLKSTGRLESPSKEKWMWELGLSTPKGVDSVLDKAGIYQKRDNLKNIALNPAKPIGQQIRRFGSKNDAKCIRLELLNQDGQVIRKEAFQSDRQAHAVVCDHAMTGGMTLAVYQLPNECSLTELPPRPQRPKRLLRPPSEAVPPESAATHDQADTPPPPPRLQLYPGQVDPYWIREHLSILLYWLRWAKKEGGQRVYINPKTGDKAPENASVAELLALLAGVSVSDVIGPNMKPEFTARLDPESAPPAAARSDGWAIDPSWSELAF